VYILRRFGNVNLGGKMRHALRLYISFGVIFVTFFCSVYARLLHLNKPVDRLSQVNGI